MVKDYIRLALMVLLNPFSLEFFTCVGLNSLSRCRCAQNFEKFQSAEPFFMRWAN